MIISVSVIEPSCAGYRLPASHYPVSYIQILICELHSKDTKISKKTYSSNFMLRKAPMSTGVGVEEQLDQLAERLKASNGGSPNEILVPAHDIEQSLRNYLRTRDIPINRLAKPSLKDRRTVNLAIAALRIIHYCHSRLDNDQALVSCLEENWTSTWSWIKFLNRVYTELDYGDVVKRKALCVIPFALLAHTKSKALKSQMQSTPDVASLIAKHWQKEGLIPDIDKMFEDALCPRPFTGTIRELLVDCPIEVGFHTSLFNSIGDVNSFASSIMEHWHSALRSENSPVGLHIVEGQTAFMLNLTVCNYQPLLTALLHRGMLPSIVKTLQWFTDCSVVKSQAAYCSFMCFTLLTKTTKVVDAERWVAQALDAGCMDAILRLGPLIESLEQDDQTACRIFLGHTLCQALVFLPVLRSAKKIIREINRGNIDEGTAGPIWESWISFKTIALQRIKIKESSTNESLSDYRCNSPYVSLYRFSFRFRHHV